MASMQATLTLFGLHPFNTPPPHQSYKISAPQTFSIIILTAQKYLFLSKRADLLIKAIWANRELQKIEASDGSLLIDSNLRTARVALLTLALYSSRTPPYSTEVARKFLENLEWTLDAKDEEEAKHFINRAFYNMDHTNHFYEKMNKTKPELSCCYVVLF